jgi:hypothetical protein
MSSVRLSIPEPPAPSDPVEAQRVLHTAKRRRLLYSQHDADLQELMEAQLGHVRTSAWGRPDTTANPFLSLWSQAAVLYNEAPEVAPSAESVDGEALLGYVEQAGLWPLMQRVQRDALALRENFLHISVEGDGLDATLVYRPVPPDLVRCKASRARPSEPVEVAEWRYIDGTWQRWITSVEDPAAPVYRVETSRGDDISGDVLGGDFTGPAYPFRAPDGSPILPWSLYHAAETGYIWDAYALREIVDGSLFLGLLLTYYQHVARNAAFDQRYAFGVEFDVDEVVTTSGATRREITADPSRVLTGRADPDSMGQPLIGSWGAAADPESILRSVSMYERRLLLLAGLQPPDVTRQEADVRSGYSLAVQQDSARAMQRIYEPCFRRADLRTLQVSSQLLGTAHGVAYPERYAINYQGIAPSPVEVAARRDAILSMLDAGLMSRVDAYRDLHEGVSEEQARAALAEIDAERAQRGVFA